MHIFKYLTTSFVLLLFFPELLFSFELSAEYTNIYRDDTASAFMLNFSTNIKSPNSDTDKEFAFNANGSYIKSDFSAINSDCYLFNFSARYKNSSCDLNPQFGILQTSELKLNIGKEFSNGGLSTWYSGIQIPLFFNHIELKPFFYFATLNALDGDLSYFMGYPKIPHAFATGTEISYAKNHIIVFYTPFNLEVCSNEHEELFTSDNYILGAAYSYNFEWDFRSISYSVSPFSAYLYASGNFSGALTQQNQQVLYFVFDYFKVNANYNTHFCAAGASGELSTNRLILLLDAGVVFCPFQDSLTRTEWKKLDGMGFLQRLIWNSLEMEDTGTQEYIWSELDKAGLVFVNIDLEYSFYKEYGTAYFRKKIFVPFSLKEKEGSQTEILDNNLDSKTVVNYLLSGISLGLSLKL